MQPDIKQKSLLRNGYQMQLTRREKKIMFSPLRLVLTLALSVFIIETSIMILFYLLPPLPPRTLFLMDSSLLTLFLCPILYYFLFKPLLHLIIEFRENEAQLEGSKLNLEEKVRERTSELDQAVLMLQKENEVRQQVEMALRESEMRFRQIFEQSEDAILLISFEDYAFLDVNPPAERLFNKNRDELISSGLSGLGVSTDSHDLSDVLRNITTEKRLGDIEHFEIRTADNEKRILSFRGKIITLQGTEIILATFRDITRRVRIEEESRNLQSRLIHANRMTSLGLLVSSVAHEINNPASYILANASLIKSAWVDLEPLLEERYRDKGDFVVGQTTWSDAHTFLPDAFDGIQDGARRIGEIVDNLKGYGRDIQSLRESRADINDVVRLSASILGHHISRLTSNFRIELAEGLPPVTGNTRQLEQVVTNLIQNALQALPEKRCGVQVLTGFNATRNEVVVRVIDEGCGIHADLAEHIMEPFFTTRLEQGGTGLGLSICATIVKDHGGQLEFSSEPGIGTTFMMRLPAAKDSNDLKQTATEAANDRG